MVRTQCICQICSCGRHACKVPHEAPKGQVIFSVYKDTYTTPEIQKTPSHKPPPTVISSSEPFQSMTTQKNDYIRHSLSARQTQMPRDNPYEIPTQPFEKVTAYQLDYRVPHRLKALSFKPVDGRRQLGQFEGMSNYKSDYKKWGTERRKPFGDSCAWVQPTQPFETHTTHQLDYATKPSARRPNCKPNATAVTSTEALETNTDYRANFTKHALPGRFVREMEQYSPSSTPFLGTTTANSDYIRKNIPQTLSFKPNQKSISSQEPFEGTTTFTTDYRTWPLSTHPAREQAQYEPPTTQMTTNTVYNTDFRARHAPPALALRNESQRRELPPFEGRSNYEENYRKWSTPKVDSCARQDQTSQPSPPFVGRSNYTENYRQHQIAPKQSHKPKEQVHGNPCPFDGTTMYRSEYVPRKLEPCMAGALLAAKSNYVLDQVQGDHQFYRLAAKN